MVSTLNEHIFLKFLLIEKISNNEIETRSANDLDDYPDYEKVKIVRNSPAEKKYFFMSAPSKNVFYQRLQHL